MAIPEVAAAAGAESTAAGTTAEGTTLRTPRKGGSAMALDRKNRPADQQAKPARRQARPAAEEKPPEPPADDEDQGDEEDHGPRRSLPNPGGVVRESSWVVLGFLGWVWVALPFIKGGPSAVGQVLAAKFVNRTPDTDHTPKGK